MVNSTNRGFPSLWALYSHPVFLGFASVLRVFLLKTAGILSLRVFLIKMRVSIGPLSVAWDFPHVSVRIPKMGFLHRSLSVSHL